MFPLRILIKIRLTFMEGELLLRFRESSSLRFPNGKFRLLHVEKTNSVLAGTIKQNVHTDGQYFRNFHFLIQNTNTVNFLFYYSLFFSFHTQIHTLVALLLISLYTLSSFFFHFLIITYLFMFSSFFFLLFSFT